jgi:hypothetical protein
VADIVYLLLIAAFFALAAAFVKACEAIIGTGELAAPPAAATTEQEPLAA